MGYLKPSSSRNPAMASLEEIPGDLIGLHVLPPGILARSRSPLSAFIRRTTSDLCIFVQIFEKPYGDFYPVYLAPVFPCSGLFRFQHVPFRFAQPGQSNTQAEFSSPMLSEALVLRTLDLLRPCEFPAMQVLLF